MDEVVKVPVPGVESVLDFFLELGLRLLLTHLEHECFLGVFNVLLRQFLHIGHYHELQQIDEDVGPVPQNLEGLAALDLEVVESFLLNLLFRRCER